MDINELNIIYKGLKREQKRDFCNEAVASLFKFTHDIAQKLRVSEINKTIIDNFGVVISKAFLKRALEKNGHHRLIHETRVYYYNIEIREASDLQNRKDTFIKMMVNKNMK
jgi:hypothetical protein